MPPTDDIPLFTEVLTEAAETFFGTRREVDAMIELLERHVEKLKARQKQVEARAALLNYVLLDGTAARGFYRGLAVTPGVLAAIAPSPAAWIQPLPFALTAKGRFAKVVGEIYQELAQACQDYMHGSQTQGRKQETEIYHGLLAGMVALINAEIRRVNEAFSPCQSLRFAKQFSPGHHEAEVPDCRYGDCLEQKLCFRPLNIAAFNLAVYPDLPPAEAVAGKITAFAKGLFRDHTRAARRVLSDLGRQSHK